MKGRFPLPFLQFLNLELTVSEIFCPIKFRVYPTILSTASGRKNEFTTSPKGIDAK